MEIPVDKNSVWIPVRTDKDVETLLRYFGGFHDSCLCEVHVSTGTFVDHDRSMQISNSDDVRARLLFQSQLKSRSAIELLFEGVTGIQLDSSFLLHGTDIYAAKLIQRDDGSFFWTPDFSATEPSSDVTYVAASTLSYRVVTAWMGETLRYGPKDSDAE